MEFRQCAPIVEIVASFSVAVTLTTLITEIRGNTLTIERQVFLDRSASFSQPYMNNLH